METKYAIMLSKFTIGKTTHFVNDTFFTHNTDWQTLILNEQGRVIFISNGHTQKECEENAKRAVKCLNMHNEAMDVILGIMQATNINNPEAPSMAYMVKKSLDLLNRDKE